MTLLLGVPDVFSSQECEVNMTLTLYLNPKISDHFIGESKSEEKKKKKALKLVVKYHNNDGRKMLVRSQ